MLTRNHRKGVVVSIVVIFLAAFAVVGIPYLRAVWSCRTFKAFCDHVREADFPAARSLVASDCIILHVTAQAVEYGGIDITKDISKARPSFSETFRHCFAHPASGNIVYFGLPEGVQNYAEFEWGKIRSIKIP